MKRYIQLFILSFSLILVSCERDIVTDTPDNDFEGTEFNYATTGKVELTVKVNDQFNSNYYYKVEVFDNNPLLTDTVVNLLTAGVARGDNNFATTIVVPTAVEALFVQQIDPLGRKTIKMFKIDQQTSAVECDFGISTTSKVSTVMKAARVMSVIPHATDYVLPASYTSLGSGAVTLSGAKYFVPAGVTNSAIDFGWLENSELYVAGEVVFNQSMYMAPGSRIVVLNGGKVTFNIAYNFEQNGTILAVYPGAVLNLNQSSSVGQGSSLINDGTVNLNAAFEIRANSVVVNNATLNAGQFTMTNNSAFSNHSTLNLSSFLMNSNTAFVNNGTLTATSTVKTSNVTSVITNNGSLRTPYFDMKTGGGTLNNYCKLECNDFGIDVGVVNNFGGSLISTKNLYANMSTISQTGAAILKTGVAYNQNATVLTEGVTYGYGVVLNGTASGASKPVVIVSKLNNRNGWQVVSLKGNMEYVLPASETAGANFYMAVDGGVSFVVAPTVTIEGSSCNNGGINADSGTGNPSNPEFPLEIVEDNAYTFAMEDLWPNLGDYDMNDFVFKMTDIKKTINSQNKVLSMSFKITPMASGSTLHLLSALQFDNIQRSNISFVSDYAGASVDAGLSLANIILFPEVHTLFGKSKPVIVNTYAHVNKVTTQTYNFNVAFTSPVSAEDVIVSALNFYMVVGDANVTNRREVHLAGFSPTTKVTKETNNYIDSNNMVWALMLPTANFKYPTESTKIYDAYPKFKLWTASAGTTNTNWYTFAESGLVYNK